MDGTDSGGTEQPAPLLTFYQHVLAAYCLFPAVKRQLADRAYDYLGELFALAQKAVVHDRKPSGVEEIRAYEPSLRAPALVFLLEGYERDRSWDEDLRCEIARWSDYLWEQDDFWEQDGEGEKELLPLVDASVQSVEDLVRWFRRNERLLDIC